MGERLRLDPRRRFHRLVRQPWNSVRGDRRPGVPTRRIVQGHPPEVQRDLGRASYRVSPRGVDDGHPRGRGRLSVGLSAGHRPRADRCQVRRVDGVRADGGRLWGVASEGNVDSWPLLPTIRATHWVDPSGKLLGDPHEPRIVREIHAATGDEGLSGLAADAHWVIAAGKDGRTRSWIARDGTLRNSGATTSSTPGKTPRRVSPSARRRPRGHGDAIRADLTAAGPRWRGSRVARSASGRRRRSRLPSWGPSAGLGIPRRDGPTLVAGGAERGGSPRAPARRAARSRRLRFSPDGRLLAYWRKTRRPYASGTSRVAQPARRDGPGLGGDGTPRPAEVQDPPTGGGQADTRKQSSAGMLSDGQGDEEHGYCCVVPS